ncbi:MAG: BppU family phage baseplate upper protein [Clostridia bacterium]|nr:BppU family phage baseplate upper protein [Clostridia bacterium]
MNTTYRISLDVHKIESQVSITTFRGDSGHKIVANLTEDGKPLPLSKNCTVNFEALKADNHTLINECYIDDGKIVYEFKQNTPEGETCQVTAYPGTVKCQFKLIGENGRIISSPRFTIVVEEAVCNEGEIGDSVSEATALTELVAAMRSIKKEADDGNFNGATFTPSVSADGVLSWSNNKELDNPEPVNIKGEKGDQGIQGIQGEKGEKGDQGIQGEKGDKGDQGIQGEKGDKGDDGYTPVKGVDYYTEAERKGLIEEILSNFVDGNEVAY